MTKHVHKNPKSNPIIQFIHPTYLAVCIYVWITKKKWFFESKPNRWSITPHHTTPHRNIQYHTIPYKFNLETKIASHGIKFHHTGHTGVKVGPTSHRRKKARRAVDAPQNGATSVESSCCNLFLTGEVGAELQPLSPATPPHPPPSSTTLKPPSTARMG